MSVSGRIDSQVFPYAVAVFGLACAASDVLRRRIFNWLTLPMMAAGLGMGLVTGGLPGLGASALGILAGFLLYSWMFAIRMMGAGDVKMLMALGAWGGIHFAVETGVLGVLVGGAMAVVSLVLQGRLFSFIDKMRRFLLSVAVKELEVEVPKADPRLTLPYGVSIAVAAIWAAIAHPLDSYFGGFRPW